MYVGAGGSTNGPTRATNLPACERHAVRTVELLIATSLDKRSTALFLNTRARLLQRSLDRLRVISNLRASKAAAYGPHYQCGEYDA